MLLCLASGCASWCSRPSSDALARSRQIALQGMEAEQQGKHREAEAMYAAAILACPNDERAQCRYAESLWRRGEHQQALAHMEESVRLSNQSAERVAQLGRMHHDLGDFSNAHVQSTRALECDKECAAAWTLRGDLARKEKRLDDALAHYQRALGLPGCSQTVSLHIADIYAEQNRPQRALGALQTLADQFPAGQLPAEIAFRQGLAFRALGRNDDALQQFAAASKHPQAPLDVFVQLAEMQRFTGDLASARLTMQTALERYPDHPSSKLWAGEFLQQQERLSAALPREQ